MRYRQLGWGGLAIGLLVATPADGVGGEDEPTSGPPAVAELRPDEVPNPSCLAATLCAIQQRIRWRTPPWSPAHCQRLADTVLEAAARERIPPALIVAVMINESSLDERATRVTMKDGAVYAKDGGLMGLRCVFDRNGRCRDGKLRGMSWNDVLDPTTNIALGAHALAYWRDMGGLSAEKVRVRVGSVIETRVRYQHCTHRDHPYWAHYNHGVRYIDHGRARLYPHHVAVLYYALSRTMQTDSGNLTSMRLSATHPGEPSRRADRPSGPRHSTLFRTILNVGPLCGDFLTVEAEPPMRARPVGPRT